MAFPTNPILNQIYFDINGTFLWNGSEWVIIGNPSFRNVFASGNTATANIANDTLFITSNTLQINVNSISKTINFEVGNVAVEVTNLENYITGVNATQNAEISYALTTANNAQNSIVVIQGVDTTQNVLIASATSLAQAAYNAANAAGSSTLVQFAANTANSASANTIYTQGVDLTQNTNISYAIGLAQAAYNQANTDYLNNLVFYAADKANSASANTIYTQGVNATQNTNITNLSTSLTNQITYQQNVDNVQNNNITTTQSWITSNVAIISGVDATQNTNISSAITLAQAAYNQANSGSSGTINGTLSVTENYTTIASNYDANEFITLNNQTNITGLSFSSTDNRVLTVGASNNGIFGTTTPHMFIRTGGGALEFQTGNIYVGSTAYFGTNLYLSGTLYDFQNNSYYIKPSGTSNFSIINSQQVVGSTGSGTPNATFSISARNGSSYIGLASYVGAGSYNPIVQTEDSLLNFSSGTSGQGSLVIAPWNANSSGIRIQNTGATTIYGPDSATTFTLETTGGSLFWQSFTNNQYLWSSNAALYFGTLNNYPLYLGTNNGARLTIDSSGNVGIGTLIPGYSLDVNGYIRNNQEIISTGTGTGQFRAIFGNYGVILRNDGTNFWILSTASGSQYGTWNSYRPFEYNLTNGNVTINGNGSVTVSDNLYTTGSILNTGTYYDGQNSAYYVKPSGTSVLNNLTTTTTTFNYSTIGYVSNISNSVWTLGNQAWTGDGPATTLANSVTGIIVNATTANSQLFTFASGSGQLSIQLDGSIFIGDSGTPYNPLGLNASSDGYLLVQSSASIGSNLYINGNHFVNGTIYDNSNTGYYVKPSGTTQLNIVLTGHYGGAGIGNTYTGEVVAYASMQGGRTYVGVDFNQYISLYQSVFVNPGVSTNIPAGYSGNGYWFGMGSGDTSGRGFDLLGTSTNQFFFRPRETGTWNLVLTNNNYSSYALPLSGGTITGNLTVNGVVYTNAGSNLQFGGSAVSGFYSDGTNESIRNANTAGSLFLQGPNGASTYAYMNPNVFVIAPNIYADSTIYDNQNTSYYLKPSGTTILNSLTATTLNIPITSGYINVGTHGTIYDDGNFHIHSTTGTLWLNAADNTNSVNINAQANGNVILTNGVGYVSVNSGLNLTQGWRNTASNTTSEISNDLSSYKALMLVGNSSGGGSRQVQVFDDLNITIGNFNLSGTYYDLTNTGYYVKPSSLSVINTLNSINGGSTSSSAINISNSNNYGGTGYAGMMTWTNTSSSATNPNKYWRINSTGDIEIVNSVYNAVILTIKDNGDFNVTGTSYADNNFYVGGNEYLAGILYDNQNTSYYVKPSGTSVFSIIQVNSGQFMQIGGPATTGLYADSNSIALRAGNNGEVLVQSGSGSSTYALYTGSTTTFYGSAPPLILQNRADGANFWQIGPDSSSNFTVYNQAQVGAYIPAGQQGWAAGSDIRLKTDLKPISNAIRKIKQLRTVTGRFKTDKKNVSRSFLIAQDVQKVFPEAVDVKDDEMKTLGIIYTDMIPLMIAAIKEQQKEIENLKQKINCLLNK